MSFLNFNWHKPSGAGTFSRECVYKLNPLMESTQSLKLLISKLFSYLPFMNSYLGVSFLPPQENKKRGTYTFKREDKGSDANRALPEAAISAD